MVADWSVFRELMLVTDVIVVALMSQLTIALIVRRKSTGSRVPLYFGGCFLAATLAHVLGIVTRYYTSSALVQGLFFVVGVGFGGVVLFLAARLLFLIYRRSTGPTKRRVRFAIIGYGAMLLGIGGSTSIFEELLVASLSLGSFVGFFLAFRGILVVGLFLLYFGFNKNVFLETGWQAKILDHYIVHAPSGESLYHRRFVESDADGELLLGGIVGIASMIQEMTRTGGKLDVIDQGPVKVLLDHGMAVINILVTREDLQIFRHFLRESRVAFERTFGPILQKPKWTGYTELFSAMDGIMDDLFVEQGGATG